MSNSIWQLIKILGVILDAPSPFEKGEDIWPTTIRLMNQCTGSE